MTNTSVLNEDTQYFVKYIPEQYQYEVHDVLSDLYSYLDVQFFRAQLRTWFTEDQIDKIIYNLAASYTLLIDLKHRHVSKEYTKPYRRKSIVGRLITPSAISDIQDIMRDDRIVDKRAAVLEYSENLIKSETNNVEP